MKLKMNKFNWFRLICLLGYIACAIVLIVESSMDGAASSAQSNAVGGTIAGIVNNVGGDDTKAIEPTSVKVNNEINEAYVGKTYKLEVETLPENATYKANDFYSSNESVASISSDGTISFLSEGEVTITVKNHDYSKISTSFDINVRNIEVSDISLSINAPLNQDAYTLYLDETYKLSTIISPNDATIKDVTYSLSDNSYIKIDTYGNITPLAYSKNEVTTILVTCGQINKDVKVKVEYKNVVKLQDYTLTEANYEIYIGQTQKINVTPIPEDAAFSDYQLTSNDSSIASISGKNSFKGVKEGKVTLTLSSITYQDITKTITVKVLAKPIVTDFSAGKENITLTEGEYHTIKISNVKPNKYADISNVSYTSSDTNYVTVSKKGKILAKKPTINPVSVTVTIGEISKTIKVTVNPYINEDVEEIDTNTIGFDVKYLKGENPILFTNTSYDLSTYFEVDKFYTLNNQEPAKKTIAFSTSKEGATINKNSFSCTDTGSYDITMTHVESGKTNIVSILVIDNYDVSLDLETTSLANEQEYNIPANSSFTLKINSIAFDRNDGLQRFEVKSSSNIALISPKNNNEYEIEVANTIASFTISIDCYYENDKVEELQTILKFNVAPVLISSLDLSVTNSNNEKVNLLIDHETNNYKFSMYVNDIYYLHHIISPNNPSSSSLVYSSSNTNILEVNSDGLLVVNGIGNVSITIKDEVTNKYKTIDIVVSNKILINEENTITFKGQDAKFDEATNTYSLTNGHSGSIKINFLEESTYKTVSYSSSDEKIISVAADGTLTPKKKGEATITMICNDGMLDEIKIEVKVKVEPQPVIKDLGAFFYKIRKSLGHYGAFLVLGIFSTLTFLLYFRKWKWLFAIPLNIALGFGLAALTEYIQTFIPGRYGCWDDIMIDFSGFMSSTVLLSIIIPLVYLIKYLLAKKQTKEI